MGISNIGRRLHRFLLRLLRRSGRPQSGWRRLYYELARRIMTPIGGISVDIPPRQGYGPADILVMPSLVIDVASGTHYDSSQWQGHDALPFAVEFLARQIWFDRNAGGAVLLQVSPFTEGIPVVIKVFGNLFATEPGGIIFNGNNAGGSRRHAQWQPFESIRDIVIVGKTGPDTDIIGGIGFQGLASQGAQWPAFNDNIRFENLQIRGNGGNTVIGGVVGSKEHPQIDGTLKFYDCLIHPGTSGHLAGGFSAKWGMNHQGVSSLDFRDCHFSNFAEHSIYAGPRRHRSIFQNLTNDGNGRTHLQLTARTGANPQSGGFDIQSTGPIFIDGCTATRSVDWSWGGGGGADYTIAGHNGSIVLRDIKSDGHWDPNQRGGIAIWRPNDCVTFEKNGEMYAHDSVKIDGYTAEGSGSLGRQLVQIDGCYTIELGDFDFVELDTTLQPQMHFSMSMLNRSGGFSWAGNVATDPSGWVGWNEAPIARKVRHDGQLLTDDEIDVYDGSAP